ncbi:MAG: hypothetical protein GY847_42160 [Proteobacteria bacterium]|nr:hypothetical protein [Pseudomonadota bacterium]
MSKSSKQKDSPKTEPSLEEGKQSFSRRNAVAAILGAAGAASIFGCESTADGDLQTNEKFQSLLKDDPSRDVPVAVFPSMHGADGMSGTGYSDGTPALLAGYHTPGDGGGGVFFYDSDINQEDHANGGTIIIGGTLGGCWVRVYDGPINVKWFGAKGDGSVPDGYAIQEAIDNSPSVSDGQELYIPAGTYTLSETLIVPIYVRLSGDGRNTILLYEGEHFALQLGNDPENLSQGCGLSDLTILVTSKNGKGVRLLCTEGAYLSNLYIEGNAATASDENRTSTGVVIDGGQASNFFNTLIGVQTNHLNRGFHMLSTGASYPTNTTFINCSAFGDHLYGDTNSVGWKFSNGIGGGPVGHGTIIQGGNIEQCEFGIYRDPQTGPINVVGTRFEIGGTYDLYNVAGCDNAISLIGCAGLDPSRISGNISKCLIYDAENGRLSINRLTGLRASLNVNGNIAFTEPNEKVHIYMPDGYPASAGSIVIQAGGGSAGFGGALSVYGHSHSARSGHVVAGISANSDGRFAVNEHAIGTGQDVFAVDTDRTPGNTRMMVYDVTTAELKRVSVGEPDSGGEGYRVLRISN